MWERGAGESPVRRALTMLTPVHAHLSPDSLAALPLGQRDARLLSLREHTFGSTIVALCECGQCGRRLEFECDTSDIRVAHPVAAQAGTITVRGDRWEATCRFPNTDDLLAAAAAPDIEIARLHLFERCLTSLQDDGGRELSADAVSDEMIAVVAMAMSEHDPQADMQLTLTCPDCRHEWTSAFDIAAFFWTELEAFAHRLIGEIHELASAYGWRENDIVRMTGVRRQAYLSIIRA